MKVAAVLIGGGAYALSFRPHGRSIWQLKCPRPAGIGHPWQKNFKKRKKRNKEKEINAYALGLAGAGRRAWAQARSWNCLIHYFNKKVGHSAFV